MTEAPANNSNDVTDVLLHPVLSQFDVLIPVHIELNPIQLRGNKPSFRYGKMETNLNPDSKIPSSL